MAQFLFETKHVVVSDLLIMNVIVLDRWLNMRQLSIVTVWEALLNSGDGWYICASCSAFHK
jgi:hypothetical protein